MTSNKMPNILTYFETAFNFKRQNFALTYRRSKLFKIRGNTLD